MVSVPGRASFSRLPSASMTGAAEWAWVVRWVPLCNCRRRGCRQVEAGETGLELGHNNALLVPGFQSAGHETGREESRPIGELLAAPVGVAVNRAQEFVNLWSVHGLELLENAHFPFSARISMLPFGSRLQTDFPRFRGYCDAGLGKKGKNTH